MPIFASSKAVVDFEGGQLGRYSSELVEPAARVLAGRGRAGNFKGKETVVRLPDVFERKWLR